jgi:protein required for attachment to host cells
MKHTRTYILIADGSRARLVLSEGRGKPLTEVPGAEYQTALLPDRELQSDRPGRVHESASAVRHAIERDSLHRREKERFACYLANVLEEKFANHEFDRLVIAAAPEVLGIIRAELSHKLQGVILGEIAKDFTKVPNNEVRDHLGDEFMI